MAVQVPRLKPARQPAGEERPARPSRRRRLPPVWVDALWAALPSWLAARVVVGVAYLAALVAMEELRPGERTLQLDQGLLAWDGSFYEDIAADGYGEQQPEALRFFPLLSLLARVVALPVGGSEGVAVVLVANVAALAAGALLYRLVVEERGDAALARRATWLLALLPPAFVLVLGYAESLFLVAAIAAFFALRRGQWWWAAAAGAAAGLTRPVGLLLVLPAAIEAARHLSRVGWRERVGRAAAVAGPVAGTAAYLGWVAWEMGDALLPFRVQQRDDLRGAFVNPVTRVGDAVGGLFGDERLGEGLHVPFIVGFALLLFFVGRRWPAAYSSYAAVLLVVALSAESLGSFERYAISAFPLVLGLADVTGSTRVERAAIGICGGGLVAFTALAWLGTYVP